MGLASLNVVAAMLDELAPAMLNTAVGSAALLGITALAALLMGRASAAARHQLWLMGIAAVLLLPILSAAFPGWHILPRPRLSQSAAAPAPAVEIVIASPVVADSPPQERPSAPPSAKSTTIKEPVMNTTIDAQSARPPQVTPAESRTPSNPHIAAVSAPGSPQYGRARSVPWSAWLLLWGLGSLGMMGRALLGHLSLWRLRTRCVVVTRGESFDLLTRLCKDFGLQRSVELLSSPVRTMPMTWGVWRARLLIPEEAAGWPSAQRRDVLFHELGHIKRWDGLTQFLWQIACALYWFNPFCWLAGRRMQIERERACDDLVVSSGVEASSYAQHLLASVSAAQGLRLAGAAIAMARPSTLEERMRAILNPRLNRRAMTKRGTLATVLLLTCALLPLSVLKAQTDPAAQPPARHEAPPASAAGKDGSEPSSGTRPSSTRQPASSGPSEPRAPSRPVVARPPATPKLGEGPTCTVDAIIYEVRIAQDQIGKLDMNALDKASENTESFEKALAALGAIRPMYRTNQSVRLSGDTITIGSEVPFVTNTRLTGTGQAINSIQYQSVGALFNLAGKAGGSGAIDLDLGVELSCTSDDGVPIGEKVIAPILRKATLSHKGPIQPRKAFVVVSVDAGFPDKEDRAVAYVARITLGDLQ